MQTNKPYPFDEQGSNLIFIISQPRSGSTLLQRILHVNQAIYSTAESWLMLHPIYALKRRGITTEYGSDSAFKTLNELLAQVPEGQDLYFGAIRDMSNRIYKRLLEISGKKYFLDKTPRYYNIIPELFTIYPNAKYIFLYRNPLAVLSSILKAWANDNPDILERSYFKRDIYKGPQLVAEGSQIVNENAIIVRYEDLVINPESIVKDLCKKLHIHYSSNMLDYGSYRKPIGSFGDPQSIENHSRPVKSSLNKWVDHLTSKKLLPYCESYLESLNKDTLCQMGYSIDEIREELFKNHPVKHYKIEHNVANKAPDFNSVVIGTSIAPVNLSKQQHALQSWIDSGFKVISLNTEKEISALESKFKNIEFLKVAINTEGRYGKPYVSIRELLIFFLASKFNNFGIVNSDIVIESTTDTIDLIKNYSCDSLVFGNRIDCDNISVFTGVRYNYGYDFFFFNRPIAVKYDDSKLCMGLPWWDLWFILNALLEGENAHKLLSPFAYHDKHENNYSSNIWMELGVYIYKKIFSKIKQNNCSETASINRNKLKDVFSSFNKNGFLIDWEDCSDKNIVNILKNFAGLPFHQYISQMSSEIKSKNNQMDRPEIVVRQL